MTAADLDQESRPDGLPSASRASAPPRVPSLGWIWGWSFALVFALLLFRSRWIFSSPVSEDGDFAANSLLANQAADFELLVGNYSRVGFHHPGPALLYVEAFGQWFFHDVLHLVPAPFNGQLVALFAFNAALVATALLIVVGLARSWLSLLAATAAVVFYAGGVQNLFSSNWMPYFYVAPFLLLVASASSIVAGRLRDAPLLVLAGGFLVHGHIAFAFFVGAMTAFVLVVFALTHRGSLRAEIRTSRRAILAAGTVLGVFLLPIVANVAFNWPGEFGRYIDYLQGETAEAPAPRTPLDVAAYVLHYWNGSATIGLLIASSLAAGILALAWTAASRDVRHFGLAVVIVSAVATGLMLIYAAKGIDDLQWDYLGIFYRSVPLFMFLTLAALAGARLALLRGRVGQVLRVAGWPVAAAVLVFGASGVGLSSWRVDAAYVKPAVDAIESAADPDAPIVVTSTSPDVFGSWPELAGTLLEAERRGLSMCISQEELALIMSEASVCTSQELAQGTEIFYDIRPTVEEPDRLVFSTPSDLFPDRMLVILSAD